MIEFIKPSRHRKRRPIALIAGVVVAIVVGSLLWFGRAEAQTYVPNRSTWEDMPQAMREGFAAGVVESFSLEVVGNEQQTANALGLHECVRDLDLDTADLATMVDQVYAADVARWGEPPISVLISQMFRACRPIVDRVRAERGLAPMRSGATID